MVRSWSAGSPRTINPPTAPQPKPSTESCIPVRPKTRNCIAVPPTIVIFKDTPELRHADDVVPLMLVTTYRTPIHPATGRYTGAKRLLPGPIGKCIAEPGEIVGADIRYRPENEPAGPPVLDVVAVAGCGGFDRHGRRVGRRPDEQIDDMRLPLEHQRSDDPPADIIDTAAL